MNIYHISVLIHETILSLQTLYEFVFFVFQGGRPVLCLVEELLREDQIVG